MQDKIAAYILNITTENGEMVKIISADLYDWLQEQVFSIQGNMQVQVPQELIDIHINCVPQAKKITSSLNLRVDCAQKDMFAYVIECSQNFRSSKDAYDSMHNRVEYVGEIDISL